jgi:SAM-dependent methyltransferase
MDASETQENADIETASEGYARRFAGPVGTWMLGRQTRIVLDMLRAHPGADVLDVGGGHAQLARPLVDANYAVTVHGSAPECANRIQDLVDKQSCRFVCAPMMELPFENASVDTALCFRLITHCEAWPELIAELCRVARRSIIIDYPTSRSLNAISGGLFSFKKKLEGNTRTWRLFRWRELEAEFAKHGFRCKRERKQFFLPMVLHRVLRTPALSAFLEGICRWTGLTYLWGSPVIVELERG